jgi:enoyl-CoA hydratase/carnithine racemase
VLDAREARRVGLLSRIVDDPRAVATALLDSDPRALRIIKQRIRDTAPVETQTDREAEAFADLVERRE